MQLSNIVDIAVSGISAQRARMTVTASNLANAESTRSAEGGPYRRRDPVFEARPLDPFASRMDRKLNTVQVTRIAEDGRDPIKRHDPSHPDADAAGFVEFPNVNVVEEMANMISASRSFEANLVLLGKAREMGQAALRIGRS